MITGESNGKCKKLPTLEGVPRIAPPLNQAETKMELNDAIAKLNETHDPSSALEIASDWSEDDIKSEIAECESPERMHMIQLASSPEIRELFPDSRVGQANWEEADRRMETVGGF
jgi:hypothetical protein